MLDELQRGVDPTSAGNANIGATAAPRARTEAEIKHEEMNAQHQRMMEQMAWKMEQLQVEQQLQTLSTYTDVQEERYQSGQA